jgi:hypothetical protein
MMKRRRSDVDVSGYGNWLLYVYDIGINSFEMIVDELSEDYTDEEEEEDEYSIRIYIRSIIWRAYRGVWGQPAFIVRPSVRLSVCPSVRPLSFISWGLVRLSRALKP